MHAIRNGRDPRCPARCAPTRSKLERVDAWRPQRLGQQIGEATVDGPRDVS